MAFGDVKGTFSANAASIPNPFDLALVSGSGAVVVGDLVYAVCNQQTALTVTACADNLGNTYTATNAGVDSGTSTGRAFYSRVTVAGTITFVRFTTTASTNNVTGCAVSFTGPFATPPIDANPANVSDVASPFTGPATGVLAQANELVVAWGAAAGNAVWTATAPNVKRVEVASAALVKSVIGSQVVSATTSIAPAWTGTNPADDTLGTTSFKAQPVNDLLADDVSSASSVTAPVLGQVHALLANDVASASSVGAPALGQVHALDATDVASTSSVGAPAIGQIHNLLANDVSSASSVSAPALTEQADTVDDLLAEDVSSASSVSSPTLGQVHILLANDAASASSVSIPAVGQVHALAADDVLSLSNVSVPSLGQVHVLGGDLPRAAPFLASVGSMMAR